MNYIEFVKPELLVIIPVLVFLGKILKDSIKVESTKIPIYLGLIGIFLSCLWVLATSSLESIQEVFMAIFISIIQGLLCAGAAVYGNQIYKQNAIRKMNKGKSKDKDLNE